LWGDFLKAPIFGQGLGTFGFAALRLVARGELNRPTIIGVDSYYYCLMLNTGIVGLLLFLLIIASAVYERRRLFRLTGDHPSRYVVHALSMAVIVCLLFGFAGNALSGIVGAIDFWLLLGALFALRSILKKPNERVQPGQSALDRRRFVTPNRSMTRCWQEVK
jgi:O-antigen ligase